MKVALISSLVGACAFLSGCGNTTSDSWYDYGNGMINLENVTHIQGVISLSYYQDANGNKELCKGQGGGGSWDNPLTSNDVDIIIDTLENVVGNECFRKVKVSSNIKFDNFTLNLFEYKKVSKENLGKVKDDLGDALSSYNSVL
ncbi:hypothetical protein HOR41_gp03 [Pseudoalteromonas phage C5a]|uniref:Lipoprotein n=1 Tax=Pseudoalteromonas phage C5a TaxID=1916107 RepID=A0A1L5C281_9CAUD|nr:hypothetical protein HOR41_gp03 [Pseudoalteromonas phage C5a]APM00213.1 hypothetical protein C5a_3 [Pseudoalteromonas phage C5a]